MSRVLFFGACIAAAFATGNALALDAVNDRKHCGSKFTEPLVPEKLFGCEMAEACKKHDICYGKCDPGGKFFGTPYCQLSEFSLVRLQAKSACDHQLLSDIDKNNGGNWVCKGLGTIYASAVVIVGQGPFNGRKIPLETMTEMVLVSNGFDELKTRTTTLATLSQQGLVDLHQPSRSLETLEFKLRARDGAAGAPQLVFKKGAQDKDFAKGQALGLRR